MLSTDFKIFKATTQINSNIYLSIKNLRYALRPHNKVNNKYELSNEKIKICVRYFSTHVVIYMEKAELRKSNL